MPVPPSPPSPRAPRHLHLLHGGRAAMTGDARTPERMAAEWFITLREEPDDAALRARLDTWLAADPRHAEAWAEIGETVRVIAMVPPERRGHGPLAGPEQQTWRRRAARSGGAVRARRLWKPAAAAAAAACLAWLAAPSVMLRMDADHISGVGHVETVRLPDGSTVVLGPDSAIAVDLGPMGRNVRLLAGQAMFEVRRDPARPFRVVAQDVTTTVLGTGFDVRMLGASTSVAVRHGRVRVEDGAQMRELGAGDWVRFAPGTPMAAGAEAPELVGEWRGGKVAVRNRPIAEAIDALRPWYGGKILLLDRALGGKPVTGTYDVRDPARSLGLIVSPHGGRVTRITPWLMIVTKD